MKIAVFYPGGNVAWSVGQGVAKVLSRMGHDVLDVGEDSPAQGTLEGQDVLFVSGPEHIWRKVRKHLLFWDRLNVPKIGWLHETVEREDYGTHPAAANGRLPVEDLKRFTPTLFTQAHQDQKYGLPFVQCGVDTKMFYPRSFDKIYPVLFTGSLYQKRRDFLLKYPELNTVLTYILVGSVSHYADLTCRAEMVLNFPSLSAMSTARVFEVMASKTALVTPIMDGPGNYDMFEDRRHLMYYTGDPMSAVRELLLDKHLRETIESQGYEEVIAKHKLEFRLQAMLDSL